MLKKSGRRWNIPFTKQQVVCVAAGIGLYAAMAIASGLEGGAISDATGLKRAGPGQGETTYEIEVSGLDKEEDHKKVPVKIPVSERRYSDQEAKGLFEQLKPQLEKEMLGENESLVKIRKNLSLKSSLNDYGIKLRWEADNPELVDSLGSVHNEKTKEKGEPAVLRARASDGSHEHTYEFHLMVYPPLLTPEEVAADGFLAWAGEEDLKQQTEDYLKLPSVYQGQTLNYYLPKDGSYRLFPVLGLLMAVLLHIKKGVDKQNQGKKREQQLLFDYSEVVSKLVVYIGAGLTVRGAFERIVAGYEAGVKEGKRGVRPAYEEMMKTVSQLGSGVSEGRAFGEFGRRCGLQPYLKLTTLLEQSQKNGSRQLRQALELEMVSAFEQRKNLAKKLGEEAGTKLLLPLFFMLGVVMVMIVVPAFLSFY
jgi:hypothetical protein